MSKNASYASQMNTPAKGKRLNLKYVNYSLFSLIAVLGVSYLVNITQMTVQGFVLRDLKVQATALYNEKMENEQAVSAAQSYYALNSRSKGLDMIAIGDVEYLSISNAGVAMK